MAATGVVVRRAFGVRRGQPLATAATDAGRRGGASPLWRLIASATYLLAVTGFVGWVIAARAGVIATTAAAIAVVLAAFVVLRAFRSRFDRVRSEEHTS